MAISLKGCDQCGRRFEVKFSFQVQRQPKNGVNYFCTQACRITWNHEHATPQQTTHTNSAAPRPSAAGSQQAKVGCRTCGKNFQPKYAFQRVAAGSQVHYFCSMECRTPVVNNLRAPQKAPKRIAVLNQKGGTGKTTTAVNLAAGLATAGKRTLVIDLDSQGHVGISLGIKGEKSLYHVLVEDLSPEDCVVPVRPNLDVITANETLASAEMFLARLGDGQNRERLLKDRMQGIQDYDYIVLDCGPSLSLLNMNALTYAEHIIVPVSCDFLSLVGVKQILKTLNRINTYLMHPISIMGILPTFYDQRVKISNEAVKTLQGHFKDKVLPPIRINARLKEAPRYKKTIFEHAPQSHGARDYSKLVDWVIKRSESRKSVA